MQLLLLMKTLPDDQDAMEAELASYAAHAISTARRQGSGDENDSLISIEERITSFDNRAAQETLSYVRAGIKELRSPFNCIGQVSAAVSSRGSDEDLVEQNSVDSSDDLSESARLRRDLYLQQEMTQSPAIDNSNWMDGGPPFAEQPPRPRPVDHLDETTPLV